jgi:AcrR family transcriptional regulator
MDIATLRRQRVKAKQDLERARILAVSTELFSEAGYAGTTVEAIASALGAQKPFIYWYFDNKEDILSELCLRSALAAKTTVVPYGPGQDPLAALYETCRRLALVSIFDFKAGILPFIAPGALSAETRSKLVKAGRAYADSLSELLKRAKRNKIVRCKDCDVAARLMCGIPMTLYRWYGPDGKMSPQDLAHEIACAMVGSAGGPSCEKLKPKKQQTFGLSLADEPWAKAYWWLIQTVELQPCEAQFGI